jgi:hypothetical protein
MTSNVTLAILSKILVARVWRLPSLLWQIACKSSSSFFSSASFESILPFNLHYKYSCPVPDSFWQQNLPSMESRVYMIFHLVVMMILYLAGVTIWLIVACLPLLGQPTDYMFDLSSSQWVIPESAHEHRCHWAHNATDIIFVLHIVVRTVSNSPCLAAVTSNCFQSIYSYLAQSCKQFKKYFQNGRWMANWEATYHHQCQQHLCSEMGK